MEVDSVPPAPSQIDTNVTVTMCLEHTGHTPCSPTDLMSQPVDSEVTAKIGELALMGNSFGPLKRMLDAYVEGLV